MAQGKADNETAMKAKARVCSGWVEGFICHMVHMLQNPPSLLEQGEAVCICNTLSHWPH